MSLQLSLPKMPELPRLAEPVVESAHKVFLAGLGAASLIGEATGKAFDQLVERGQTLESRGRKSFDSLAKRGRKLKSESAVTIDRARDRASAGLEDLQSELDEQMTRLAQKLGIPHRDQIRKLSDRVEHLTRQIEAMGGQVTAEPGVVELSTFHLTHGESGWEIKPAGASETLAQRPTKDQALVAGREIAEAAQPSRLVVHRTDGTEQTSYTYGVD